jgi:hypothetical protein
VRLGVSAGQNDYEEREYGRCLNHYGKIVTQKHLTSRDYRNTLILMANVLSIDKQIGVISALAEGSSIRSIERMTGVHRDTIMRLGVRAIQKRKEHMRGHTTQTTQTSRESMSLCCTLLQLYRRQWP